jgi:DNA-binding NtrC family response regulator
MSAALAPPLGRVLVVDDEKQQRDILQMILDSEGYAAETAPNGPQALEALRERHYDLVLTDLKMPGMNGVVLLQELLRTAPHICVILMTAHGSIDTAVDAMKKGAFDYLSKPLEREQLLIVLRRSMERVRLQKENRLLQEQLRDRYKIENIVGESGAMQDVFRVLHKVAKTRSSVLIQGESGTGKELVARAIHVESDRAAKPFYAVSLAALPDSALESELFGWADGAGSSADPKRLGLVEQASGSTLFLEDVAELPKDAQARLLRLVVDGQLLRVGGSEPVALDVRIVAATQADLEQAVRAGRFRKDLYHRLAVIQIVLPPLRQRKLDVRALAEHFVAKHSQGRQRHISQDALKLLCGYDWPGNVRELESVIERTLLLAENETISRDDLPAQIRAGIGGSRGVLGLEIPDAGIDLQAVERSLVLRAIEKAGGNLARAARLLGLSRRALQARLESMQGVSEAVLKDAE